MAQTATITISSGPDRGREFQLDEELVHIGRAEANEIRLTDPDVPDHQASIVRRNGRYAICAMLERSVDVDGSQIPGQRWVWLPEAARVRLSPQTVLVFRMLETVGETSAGERSEASRELPPVPARGSDPEAGGVRVTQVAAASPGRPRPPPVPQLGDAGAGSVRVTRAATPRRPARAGRQVARFITDATGEPLVRLGEDGHLPELALSEGPQRPRRGSQRSPGSPLAVYAAVASSVLISLILLLLPDGSSGPSAREKAHARREIEQFYDRRGGELEAWQRLLREARLAQGRGDRTAERAAYRRVLELLNSEEFLRPGAPGVGGLRSLTGDPRGDQRLRELIGVLLE